MKTLKKAVSVILAVAVLVSMFTLFADAAGSTVSFVASGGKRSNEELSTGLTAQVQFKTTASFTSAGIAVNSTSGDKTIVMSLYKWVSNPKDTRAAGPVATQTYTEWERNSVLAVTGNFDAGEYMVELYVQEGTIKINWYSAAVTGVQGFRNNIQFDGTPTGEIVVEGGAASLTAVTPSTEIEISGPPAESVIAEDSAIATINMDSTQWSFVDGLGRSDVTYEEAGAKNDKLVGMFYWTWHWEQSGSNKPINVNTILTEYPEATNDYNHSIWKTNQAGAYFWDEPIWGYYKENDDYVLRKQAEMLADAGVDFVVFDCTNGTYTWTDAYMNVCKVWEQARQDGVKTPQIAFMLPFGNLEYNNTDLHELYNKLYRTELYQDLWFYWEGKPLIMGYASSLDANDPEEAEILNFFTFRAGEPSYWEGDQDDDTWGWLHVYPQALYKNSDGTVEMTTVGVAQNADYTTMSLSAQNSGHNMGRGYSMQADYSYSYFYRGKEIVCSSSMDEAYKYGINFQEQWDYAISVDPQIIFVTGWNEWIAGRYEEWCGVENAFPDQCNDENSRDIEPTTGPLKDYFYYQLVNNIRKYKGMSAPVYQTVAKTIDISGSTDQWNDDGFITYKAYANNTYTRDIKGWSGTHYTNDGIRNDFVTAKVSYDEDYIYFYVETVNDITAYTDADWMRLLIDTQDATADSTDWEEFEYIVGRETGTSSTLALEHSTGGWNWEKVADVSYTVNGNVMQLKIAKADLGISGDTFTFNFKWADANIDDGDIMTLYTDGDCAPLGRFTYVFAGSATAYVDPTIDDNTKTGCFGIISGGAALVITLGAGVVTLIKRRKETV